MIRRLIYIIPVLLILFAGNLSIAQTRVQAHIDGGNNSAVQKTFLRAGLLSSYSMGKFWLEAGVQLDMNNYGARSLNAYRLSVSRDFVLWEHAFNARALFISNRFSEYMYEANWGLLAETGFWEHIGIGIGISSRTYIINRGTRQEMDIEREEGIMRENLSITYRGSASLKPAGHNWNLALNISNYDHFLIEQFTNPAFGILGKWSPKHPAGSSPELFAEFWYRQAGMLNINANYFGWFIRAGVKYEF